jgi:chromatin assembly factor 1 subunit A
VEQFNDASMAGDVSTAKSLISILSDRRKLPLRWLYFYENSRPMYVGTWSKTSKIVGPRSPFAKEDEIDYSYDSGEEWYEEEEGEEMEDLETLDGDEEDEEDEEDNGDWIVDDDEEELEPDEDGGLVLSLDEIGSGLASVSKGKRKADGLQGFGRFGKRRKVIPLKPDCKGPFWETTLGHPHIASWSQFSIRVLNGDLLLFLSNLLVY